MHFAASVYAATPRTIEDLREVGNEPELDLELDALSAREASPRDVKRVLRKMPDIETSWERAHAGGCCVHVNTRFPCCGISGGYVCLRFSDPADDREQRITCEGTNLLLLLEIVQHLARRTGPLVVQTDPEKLVLVDEDSEIEALELLL
jgi:hypothetical protein